MDPLLLLRQAAMQPDMAMIAPPGRIVRAKVAKRKSKSKSKGRGGCKPTAQKIRKSRRYKAVPYGYVFPGGKTKSQLSKKELCKFFESEGRLPTVTHPVLYAAKTRTGGKTPGKRRTRGKDKKKRKSRKKWGISRSGKRFVWEPPTGVPAGGFRF